MHTLAVIQNEIVINAPASRVWEIISDLDSEPKFWKGTKSIVNKSKDGNTVIREITLAFRDKVCEQRITLESPTSVIAEFTRGIIKGSKTALIEIVDDSSSRLTVTWDIAMTGMMSMFTSMIVGHIRSGTDMALEAIKAEAESR